MEILTMMWKLNKLNNDNSVDRKLTAGRTNKERRK